MSRQKHVNSLAAAEMGKIESRTITSDDMLVTEILRKELSAVLRKAQGCVPQPCAASSRFGDDTSKAHFGTTTLQGYTGDKARRFLSSLTKQGKNTLEHIRALASAMFSEAIGATPVLITLGM